MNRVPTPVTGTALAIGATFNDGRHARRHRVTLAVEDGVLVVTGADGTEHGRWPLAEVRLVAAVGTGAAPRLAPGFERDERLTLDALADLGRLSPHCPNLHRTSPPLAERWRTLAAWGAAAAVSVVLVVTVFIPWAADEVAAVLPPSWQRETGDSLRDRLVLILARPADRRVESGLCTGSPGAAVLTRLADRLAATLERPLPYPLTVSVVDTDTINALALPGGHVLVLRGLLDIAETPNELAGVLAHEIAHIANRHPTALALEKAATAALVGLLVGDVFGGGAVAAVGNALLGAAYSRDVEAAADAQGTEMMNRAGLDARGLGAFLRRLEKRKSGLPGPLAFLSTHPGAADRADAVAAVAAGTRDALGPDDWRAVKAMCAAHETEHGGRPERDSQRPGRPDVQM